MYDKLFKTLWDQASQVESSTIKVQELYFIYWMYISYFDTVIVFFFFFSFLISQEARYLLFLLYSYFFHTLTGILKKIVGKWVSEYVSEWVSIHVAALGVIGEEKRVFGDIFRNLGRSASLFLIRSYVTWRRAEVSGNQGDIMAEYTETREFCK